MKSRSRMRLGTFAFLLLLTFAAGAQAAAAQSGGGAVTPPAGTEGRGGVAASGAALTVDGPKLAESQILARHGRGAFPVGPPAGAEVSISSSSSGWIAAGLAIAAVALILGFFAWAANRRRVWRRQSSLASYCTYHPSDSLC